MAKIEKTAKNAVKARLAPDSGPDLAGLASASSCESFGPATLATPGPAAGASAASAIPATTPSKKAAASS